MAKYFTTIILFCCISLHGQTPDPSAPLILVWQDEFNNFPSNKVWKGEQYHATNSRFVGGIAGVESQFYTGFDNNMENPWENYILEYNPLINSGIISLVATDSPISGRITQYHPDNYPHQITSDPLQPFQDIDNFHHFEYRSGELESMRKFRYGYFSIGFQMPEGFGLWPAFWLFGHSPSTGGYEIDVFEMQGDQTNTIPTNFHEVGSGNQEFTPVLGSFSSTWNVISLEWQPFFNTATQNLDGNLLIWRLNGNVFRTELANGEFLPLSVIVNLAVGGPPWIDYYVDDPVPGQRLQYLDLSATTFPKSYKIDFIRIYKRMDCSSIINLEGYDNFTEDGSYQIAGIVNVAGSGNQVVVNGSTWGWTDKERLDIIASDQIHIMEGFHAEANSFFHAKTIECPLDGIPTINSEVDKDYDGLPNVIYIPSMAPEGIIDGGSLKLTEDVLNTDLIGKNKEDIHVYPNPTNGMFTIGGLTDESGVIIYAPDGRVVFENKKPDQNLSINLSEFAQGVYIVEIITESRIKSYKIQKR